MPLPRAHKLGLQIIVFTDMDSEHADAAFEAMEGWATVISDDLCDSRGSNSRITYGLDSYDGCRASSSSSSVYSGVGLPPCVCSDLPLCCGDPDLPLCGCGSDLPSRADAGTCLLRPAARANVLAGLVAVYGWGFGFGGGDRDEPCRSGHASGSWNRLCPQRRGLRRSGRCGPYVSRPGSGRSCQGGRRGMRAHAARKPVAVYHSSTRSWLMVW